MNSDKIKNRIYRTPNRALLPSISLTKGHLKGPFIETASTGAISYADTDSKEAEYAAL